MEFYGTGGNCLSESGLERGSGCPTGHVQRCGPPSLSLRTKNDNEV